MATAVMMMACASGPTLVPEATIDALGLHSLPVELCVYEGAVIRAFILGDPEAPRRYIFIHGWAGSGAEFLQLAEALTLEDQGAAIWCIDLPGSGSSDKPAGAAYDLPFFRGAIRSVVETVSRSSKSSMPGADPPETILAGHSLGGHFVIDYMVHDGTLVDRLVLLAPAGWPGESGIPGVWASGSGAITDIALAFITEDTYIAGVQNRVLFDPAKFPEASARYAGIYLATPDGKAALKAVTLNALEHDTIEGSLNAITVPVFLAWGRNDRILPYRYAQLFLAALPPGTVFMEFDRCGHTPHVEYPQELAAAIAKNGIVR